MADTKISALTAATAGANADEYAINQSSTSKKITGSLKKEWLGCVLYNADASQQAPASSATTYLTGSNITVPAGKLRANTVFRWTIQLGKTNAGTAARSILVLVGTAGTTSDATIATLTSGTPSGATDTGCYIVTFAVTSIGASAASRAAYQAMHQLSTTGLFANETEAITAAGTAFDSTTANLIVGLAVTTGASEALTIYSMIAEAFNL